MPKAKVKVTIDPNAGVDPNQAMGNPESIKFEYEDDQSLQFVLIQNDEQKPASIAEADSDTSDPEEVLKSYYNTHSNSFGDMWYICKTCPTFRTSHNSTMRDHVNCLHLKSLLKCTHCEFETYRFKTLNCHRKQVHDVAAMKCWVEKCNFKTILTDRMIKHGIKKHGYKM